MLDALLFAHPFGLDGQQRADVVQEEGHHHSRDLQVELLFLTAEYVKEGIAGLVEQSQGVLIDVVVHTVLDELVVNIKPAHRVACPNRNWVAFKGPLTHHSGFLRLR